MRRRQKGRKERRGDSDSTDKQQLILLQATQPGRDIIEESRRPYTVGPRRFNTTGYYALDLHTGTVSNLPRTVQVGAGPMSSVVAVGSRIYIFGTQILEDPHKHPNSTSEAVVFNPREPRLCYVLDRTNSQTSWKEASPPLSADQCQLDGVVAFRGKVYFFRDSRVSCFCQVYDPKHCCWSRIKSPPGGGDAGEEGQKVHLVISPPVLADYKNNRIIVCFNNVSTMYAYYPSTDRWECLVEGFTGWFSSLQPVTLADGVIYVHHRTIHGFFKAFDLATKQ